MSVTIPATIPTVVALIVVVVMTDTAIERVSVPLTTTSVIDVVTLRIGNETVFASVFLIVLTSTVFTTMLSFYLIQRYIAFYADLSAPVYMTHCCINEVTVVALITHARKCCAVSVYYYRTLSVCQVSSDELPLVISFVLVGNRPLRIVASSTVWSLVHDRHMESHILIRVPIMTALTTSRLTFLI